MIKVSVLVPADRLEGFVAQMAALDLKFAGIAVVPDEVPRPSRSPARKRYTRGKGKGKRRSGAMEVKLATLTRHVPPKMEEAHKALQKEFGDKTFEKRLASGVIQKALKMKNRPTAHVSALLDAGGLVQV